MYTSGTLSLAALEYLVHVDSDILPDGLVSIRATIPDGLKIEGYQCLALATRVERQNNTRKCAANRY